MARRIRFCSEIATRLCLAAMAACALAPGLPISFASAAGPTADQIKRTLLDEVRFYRDVDLAQARAICADHYMPHEVRGLAAKGTPHPGTVPMCTTVLTESLKRDAGIDLYTNLAVTELTGRTGIMDDLDVTKIIKNNESAKTFMAVRDGAQADRTSYRTVRDRELPLTTALAIDAGTYAGYRQPNASIAPSQTDDDVSRTFAQCFEENSNASRKACFLAGVRFGQSVRRSVDAAGADPTTNRMSGTPAR